MDPEERLETVRSALRGLVQPDTPDGSFVIFEHPDSGKFVQFVSVGGALICDIPVQELSDAEAARLRVVPGMSLIEAEDGEPVSYQAMFSPSEIEAAAELVESVFVNVFQIVGGLALRVTGPSQ